jgi:hypothetical protein
MLGRSRLAPPREAGCADHSLWAPGDSASRDRSQARLTDRGGEEFDGATAQAEGQPIRRRNAVIGCCAAHRTRRRPRWQRSAHSAGRGVTGRDDGDTGWTAGGSGDIRRSAGDRFRSLRSEANDGIDGANGDSRSSDVPIFTPTDGSRWDPSGLIRLRRPAHPADQARLPQPHHQSGGSAAAGGLGSGCAALACPCSARS